MAADATYAWNGTRFDQTAGPAKFGIDPRLTDLTLSAGELVLDPPDADGIRTGSVTVTITNKGPVDVPQLGFGDFHTIGKPAGGDLSECRMITPDGSETCLLDGLPAGEERSLTFRFQINRELAGGAPSLRVKHVDGQDREWKDLKPADNSADLRMSN